MRPLVSCPTSLSSISTSQEQRNKAQRCASRPLLSDSLSISGGRKGSLRSVDRGAQISNCSTISNSNSHEEKVLHLLWPFSRMQMIWQIWWPFLLIATHLVGYKGSWSWIAKKSKWRTTGWLQSDICGFSGEWADRWGLADPRDCGG